MEDVPSLEDLLKDFEYSKVEVLDKEPLKCPIHDNISLYDRILRILLKKVKELREEIEDPKNQQILSNIVDMLKFFISLIDIEPFGIAPNLKIFCKTFHSLLSKLDEKKINPLDLFLDKVEIAITNCIQTEERFIEDSSEESLNEANKKLKDLPEKLKKMIKEAILAGGIGGFLAILIINAALPVLGFTSAGIASGSFGAWLMSTYGGTVASGSLVASLQSAGVVGFGAAVTGGVAVIGVTVAVVGYFIVRAVRGEKKCNCKQHKSVVKPKEDKETEESKKSRKSEEKIEVQESLTVGVESWNTDKVINWMKGLHLAQDYAQLIKDENINGKVLKTMKTKEDWKELGITKFGDLRLLVSGVEELFA